MGGDTAGLVDQVLAVTLPVFGIVMVGFLFGRLDGTDMAIANRFNINLFVPAQLFSVLPPAVLNYLLAERHDTAPGEVASMVAIGNLASLVVAPAALTFML
jgi:predicted permease